MLPIVRFVLFCKAMEFGGPAAGRAYNIPSARDPKRWNLSIFSGNQPWGTTWLCILFFCLKVGYFDFVKNILKSRMPMGRNGIPSICFPRAEYIDVSLIFINTLAFV